NIILNKNTTINTILENPTVKKLIDLIKTNPLDKENKEIVKEFIRYILSYNLPESSIFKQDLEKLIFNCYGLKN
ncbi:hypothetical protein L6269_04280, partial [Candidatus Dependentiae bacterium]|nr:hypothetical protein [Candidatus Dependentiae bacterium]